MTQYHWQANKKKFNLNNVWRRKKKKEEKKKNHQKKSNHTNQIVENIMKLTICTQPLPLPHESNIDRAYGCHTWNETNNRVKSDAEAEQKW